MKRAIGHVDDACACLAQLTTANALIHLQAAVGSLESLAERFQEEGRPAVPEQREMERDLMQFRTELRRAGVLTEQGLAFCKDWAETLQAPGSYQASGIAQPGVVRAGTLSVDG